MKIGIVTPGGFDRSGTERIIPIFLSLVERLARQHEVHVYMLYQYPQPQDYCLRGATIHNLGGTPQRSGWLNVVRRGMQAVLAEHRRSRFDVIHGLWANESGLIAGLAARKAGVPGVVTAMCGELVALPAIQYGAQRNWRGRLLVRAALRLPQCVTCESRYAARLLRAHRPDAQVLTFGPDCEQFAPPARSPIGPPWNLLHVASLNRVKDQPTLLRAFARIRAALPETRLEIIGVDTLNGEIQRLAHTLGLADSVTFHGFQPAEVVAAKMQSAHLLLMSSLSEAAPVVFLEAAACAAPTVGTAVGLIADHAPEAALAVPVGRDDELAEATLALLRDPARRLALGLRARAVACANNADTTAARVEALYTGL